MKDKTIPINIQGQPPTQAELDAAKKRAKLYRWGALIIYPISFLIFGVVYVDLSVTVIALIICLISLYLFVSNEPIDFETLNPEKSPDACLNYSKLLSDPAVAAYHAQILAQGRGPVIMEYRAARAWISAAPERKKQAQAKAAFAKINPTQRGNHEG